MPCADTTKDDLLSLCPGVAAAWDDKRDLWANDNGSFTVHGVFAVFSDYIADRLTRGSDPELRRVFEYVESKLTEDDSEVNNAATTCFLENLMNRVPETIPPRHLI